MSLVAKVDEYGRPAWIALTVLSFIIFWPIGLAALAFLIWSGRMGNWRNFGCAGRGKWHAPDLGLRSSGNRAFDEYRAETLKRLESERQEFMDYLDKLRHARDKEEFDRFMAERAQKNHQAPTEGESPQAA